MFNKADLEVLHAEFAEGVAAEKESRVDRFFAEPMIDRYRKGVERTKEAGMELGSRDDFAFVQDAIRMLVGQNGPLALSVPDGYPLPEFSALQAFMFEGDTPFVRLTFKSVKASLAQGWKFSERFDLSAEDAADEIFDFAARVYASLLDLTLKGSNLKVINDTLAGIATDAEVGYGVRFVQRAETQPGATFIEKITSDEILYVVDEEALLTVAPNLALFQIPGEAEAELESVHSELEALNNMEELDEVAAETYDRLVASSTRLNGIVASRDAARTSTVNLFKANETTLALAFDRTKNSVLSLLNARGSRHTGTAIERSFHRAAENFNPEKFAKPVTLRLTKTVGEGEEKRVILAGIHFTPETGAAVAILPAFDKATGLIEEGFDAVAEFKALIA